MSLTLRSLKHKLKDAPNEIKQEFNQLNNYLGSSNVDFTEKKLEGGIGNIFLKLLHFLALAGTSVPLESHTCKPLDLGKVQEPYLVIDAPKKNI